MPKVCELSDYTKGQIEALHLQNISNREIARQLRISEGSVRYNIRKLTQHGNMSNIHRSGRPRLTSPREDRILVRASLADRFVTARDLRANFSDHTGKLLSVSTVKSRLYRGANLRGCVAKKKPKLQPRHIAARLQFARNHIDWTAAEWSRVVWSDESKFTVYRSRGRLFVRRRPGEEYELRCLNPTVKFGGGSVMVWGCFSADGVGSIVRVDTNMDRWKYLDILQNVMIPSALRLVGPDFIFQQDNAPVHTALVVKSFLDNPAEYGYMFDNFSTLKWPAQSPDLNPIENLWEMIDMDVHSRQIHSIDDLFNSIVAAWERFQQEKCRKLVNTLPNRLREVIQRRGGHTHYWQLLRSICSWIFMSHFNIAFSIEIRTFLRIVTMYHFISLFSRSG